MDCLSGWRDPFLPSTAGAWGAFPTLKDIFIYDGSGVMPGRTWVIAPDVQSLTARWSRLAAERNPEKKELLFHPHLRKNKPGDKHVRKTITQGLAGHEERLGAVIRLNLVVTAFDPLIDNGSYPTLGLSTSQTQLCGRPILHGRYI
jgi:hypothetical protein